MGDTLRMLTVEDCEQGIKDAETRLISMRDCLDCTDQNKLEAAAGIMLWEEIKNLVFLGNMVTIDCQSRIKLWDSIS